jgi:hypothetical protein
LVPSVRANLEHRHSYVRRNAVMAIYYIYKSFEFLIPDAAELVFDYLNSVCVTTAYSSRMESCTRDFMMCFDGGVHARECVFVFYVSVVFFSPFSVALLCVECVCFFAFV